MKKFFLIIILIIPALIYFLYPEKGIQLVFLTWENEDTSHTMTVNYLTGGNYQTTLVYYDTQPRNGKSSQYRYQAYGSQRNYPGVNFTIHTTQLKNLNPDNTYYFIVGDQQSGFSAERKFKTVPEHGRINFISGGDAGTSKEFEKMSEIAAESEPSFAIIGGDIAYVNGDIQEQDTWKKFLDIWQRKMVTPSGYTIPIIAAIGNHEINKKSWRNIDKAPFYFMLFKPDGEKTYFTRQIGTDNILFVLDTNHIHRSYGDQLDWMKKKFREFGDSTFRIASYHKPLYPSFRDPDAQATKNLRRHWLPIFDENYLHVAFENHEHTLKKTKLLKNDHIAENQGTYYLGDGNWGRTSRIPQEQWYLEAARPINHVWSVELDERKASFKVLTIDGIDESYSIELSP